MTLKGGILIPLSSFHAARQRDPDQYARIRVKKNKGGRGVDFLFGFKKGGGSEIQSIHFDKKLFTPAQAKKWLKAHGFSTNLESSAEGLVMTVEAHTPSHEELRELISQAINKKFPNGDHWYGRFSVSNVWDDRALLHKSFPSENKDDPKWALVDYSIDEGGEDGTPSVTIGELVPVSIQAVPKDGGDGVVLDEAGRRNANSDATKINQAIRALLATLNDDDLEEETINVLNAKMLAPINGEGDFQDFGEAVWSAAFINDLPDSSFALVRPGKKDESGKTVPRTNRFLPYKDGSGKVDLPHLRNALARLPQTNLSDKEKARAKGVLQAAAKRAGVGAGSEGSTGHEKDTITEAWNNLPGETFQEAFNQALSEVEIDHDNLILKNVVVLGPVSTNRRKYSVETQQKALPLFEGIRAYVNHPKMNEMNEPRDMRDLVGEHKNIRMVGDRTVSDLHLLDNATVRDVVLPVAESKPHLVGNSIVARGKMVKEKDGTDNVEEILAVRSVDIVTEPATTKSLFAEGRQLLSTEEDEMELKSLTLETLKKERPDLFEAVSAALTAELEAKTTREAEAKALKDEVTALKAKAAEQEAGILERDKKIATHELEKAKAQKDALVEGIFKAAKIPDRVKYAEKDGVKSTNPHFRSLMERCQDETEMKELVKTWEETYRQGPVSQGKQLDFGDNGNVNDAALDRLFVAVQ